MAKTIVLVGALDTKGADYAFVKELIEKRGHRVLVVDTSVTGEPGLSPDVPSSRVADAGGESLATLREKDDRGAAMDVMTRGTAVIVRELYEEGRLDGIIALGGSAGTSAGTSAMRALPLGVPKVMVSTVAAGDTKAYVGTRDVVMFPSVVDVAGVNAVSARIYANAVGAVVGMVETEAPQIEKRPLVAATMFGNTTPVVNRAVGTLQGAGYEVLVFHATGTGGQTMESLVDEGFFEGVMDITTTEWADELTGGVFSAGPHRLEAAARKGIPQVIVPGCLDMANFSAPDTIPGKYKDRRFYHWNPNVTLMRTTPDENRELGRILAEKANASTGPVVFLLPLKGVSMLDSPGKEFWWPEANEALFEAIKSNVRQDIPVHELDHNINDDAFADTVASEMMALLEARAGTRGVTA
jgi:uncharacterized protein (UPF0261 family)